MSICDYLEEILTGQFSVACQRKENSISVSPQNQNGFEVELRDDENEITVIYEGWHEHFDNADVALNCFLVGLTNRHRLCVESWGTKAWKWTPEYLDEDTWSQYGGTMRYLVFPRFWQSRETKYLQNDAIEYKAVKEHIWNNALQDAADACSRGELDEAKEILLSIQEEAKEFPLNDINEHVIQELELLEIESDLVRLYNLDKRKALTEASLEETEEIAIECVNAFNSANSYMGMTVMVEPTEEGGVEYRVTFVKPESYHVVRTVVPEDDQDEWITIGSSHWRIPFGPMADMRENELAEAKSLLVDPYINILRERKASRSHSYKFFDEEFWVLGYNLDSVPGLLFLDQITGSSINVEIWIDANTYFISKTTVSQKDEDSQGELKIIQAFSGFDSDLTIEEPTDFI